MDEEGMKGITPFERNNVDMDNDGSLSPSSSERTTTASELRHRSSHDSNGSNNRDGGSTSLELTTAATLSITEVDKMKEVSKDQTGADVGLEEDDMEHLSTETDDGIAKLCKGDDSSIRVAQATRTKRCGESERRKGGSDISIDVEAEAGVALLSDDEEDDFDTTATKKSEQRGEQEGVSRQHTAASATFVDEIESTSTMIATEPIIPVATAEIIPIEEPVIQLTVAVNDEEEGGLRYGQTVRIDESQSTLLIDGDDNSDHKQRYKKLHCWCSRQACVVLTMIMLVVGLLILIILYIPTRGSAHHYKHPPVDRPSTPPPPSPITLLPYTWSVEEFGMPDTYNGGTYPWNQLKTLEECQSYCENVSGGAYTGLAFVNEIPWTDDYYFNNSNYGVDDELLGTPDCFCFKDMICLYDYSYNYNGTVLSKSERPLDCTDDYIEDDAFFNITTNFTDDIGIDDGYIAMIGDDDDDKFIFGNGESGWAYDDDNTTTDVFGDEIGTTPSPEVVYSSKSSSSHP